MQTTTRIHWALLALITATSACNNGINQQTKSENKMQRQKSNLVLPTADKWVNSPVRNRITLELNAPVTDVWALVGDPAKMPSYSSGLNRVDTQTDDSGRCTGYTCYFKPMEEGGQEIVHSSKVVWYEPNYGCASLDEEPNVFCFRESLTLITLEQKDDQTLLNWSMHFNCESPEVLQLNVASLEQALNGEIAQQLTKRFGGRAVESYADVLQSAPQRK